ncbi:hypothetical protein FB451DRAFT_1453003 [Mycena latifolia]|nr:hypothetical protein FB451DRAFT_1453003 [Mycena latifolia]
MTEIKGGRADAGAVSSSEWGAVWAFCSYEVCSSSPLTSHSTHLGVFFKGLVRKGQTSARKILAGKKGPYAKTDDENVIVCNGNKCRRPVATAMERHPAKTGTEKVVRDKLPAPPVLIPALLDPRNPQHNDDSHRNVCRVLDRREDVHRRDRAGPVARIDRGRDDERLAQQRALRELCAHGVHRLSEASTGVRAGAIAGAAAH